MDKLRFLIETFIDYQKDRIRLENRLRSLPPELANESFFQALRADARRFEQVTERQIGLEVNEDPLFTEYLQYQKGVGIMMGGYLIAWLARERDITVYVVGKVADGIYKRKRKKNVETFTLPPYAKVLEEHLEKKVKNIRVWMPPVMTVAENPSALHKYNGLAPGSKRVSGKQVDYNPRLKTLMWKIHRQLMMARGEWAKIYARDKAAYAERCLKPDWGTKPLKVHLTTKNIVMRKFMTNLWLVYRQQNNLPVTEPYAHALGHTITRPFIETEEGVRYL